VDVNLNNLAYLLPCDELPGPEANGKLVMDAADRKRLQHPDARRFSCLHLHVELGNESALRCPPLIETGRHQRRQDGPPTPSAPGLALKHNDVVGRDQLQIDRTRSKSLGENGKIIKDSRLRGAPRRRGVFSCSLGPRAGNKISRGQ
jgi:hypothetical protein